MENAIIIAVLLVLLIFALLRVRKHFKGGCCSSGGSVVRSSKKLTGPKVGEKTIAVEGMHCENCAARIENALNRLNGVACRVNLRKKTACVSYSVEVSEAMLKQIIEDLGYRVMEIR